MSNNALQAYQKVENPLDFTRGMAKACASVVNCTLEMGEAVALVCLCEGIHPVDFIRKYHLVNGKPTMRADAMLAEFRMNHGGDYEIISRTPERAAIKIIDNKGRPYELALTKQEALDSRWPWKDWKKKDEGLKDNWATDLDMKNMLWARLVSDSLRAICPELVAGVYTPEEMADVVEGQVVSTRVVDERPTAAEIMAKQSANGDEAIEGEIVEEGSSDTNEDTTNDHLIELIRTLFNEMAGEDAPSEIDKALKKRKVNSFRSLTREQLVEMRDKLTAAVEAQRGN